LAAAKKAGATMEEIRETLYLAMRGTSRAVYSFIKHSMPEIDEDTKQMKASYESEQAALKR
jgi:hypothetical protein